MDELEIQPLNTPEETNSATPEPEPEAEREVEFTPAAPQTVSIEEWMASSEPGVAEAPQAEALEDAQLLAVLEACVYVAEEPVTVAQLAAALHQDAGRIGELLQQLMVEFERPEHGVSIKEIAGGYKMATKAEHHEAVRSFVKSLKPPLKLSLPALETLAVIAYKQPVTTPEIMDIRGVQGGGVIKTLLDRKLITEAGRKNVIGKPILYKTTKEFLIQFGLKDLGELPSLKEFEEIRRMAMADSEVPAVEAPAEAVAVETPREETPTGEAPTEGAPVVEAPAVESPDVETPSEAMPAGEAPTEGAPTAEAPAAEAPVAEESAPVPAPEPAESQEQ
jgi:segregation and condensation protein B